MRASKRDYEALAQAIRLLALGTGLGEAKLSLFVDRVSDILSKSNPKFDRTRFKNACFGRD